MMMSILDMLNLRHVKFEACWGYLGGTTEHLIQQHKHRINAWIELKPRNKYLKSIHIEVKTISKRPIRKEKEDRGGGERD